jgi:hypothetical protein
VQQAPAVVVESGVLELLQRQLEAVTDEEPWSEADRQVRKTPSWPRSWANFSPLWLYSHRNIWADLQSNGPISHLSRSQGYQETLREYVVADLRGAVQG